MLAIFRGSARSRGCLTVEIMQPSDSPDTTHASSRLKLSAVAAACALLSSALVTGHVWSTAVGLVLALAGLVLGIVALATSRKVESRFLITFLAILAIVWGAINAFGGGSRLIVWPASEIYQDCVDSALTISSSSHCQQQLEDNIWNYLSGSELESGPVDSTPDTEPSESATPSPSPERSEPATGSATPSPSEPPTESPATGS